MSTKELTAYIKGPDLTALTEWIESIGTDLGQKQTFDMSEDIEQIMVRYDGKHEFILLQEYLGTGWLELTIRLIKPESIFSAWDNIQFGERLVDDLGGITLVDGGGKYVEPLAPFCVRISAAKMEVVYSPVQVGDPFDESLTKLIKKR